jgi:hypothetical protein
MMLFQYIARELVITTNSASTPRGLTDTKHMYKYRFAFILFLAYVQLVIWNTTSAFLKLKLVFFPSGDTTRASKQSVFVFMKTRCRHPVRPVANNLCATSGSYQWRSTRPGGQCLYCTNCWIAVSGQAAWSATASHEPSGLFNDAVGSSSYLTSNSRLISETYWESCTTIRCNWAYPSSGVLRCVTSRKNILWWYYLHRGRNLRYSAGILLEGLMKTMKELRIRSSTPVHVKAT